MATEGINMSMMAVGAADYAKAIDGLSLSQAKLLLSLQGVDAEQQKSLLLQAGLISSSDQMTASHVSQALSASTLDTAEKNRLLTKLGLVDAETGELLISNSCTEAKLREALATTALDTKDKERIVTAVLGTSTNGGYAISFDVLTGSILKNIAALAKWIVTNPVGQIGLVIAAVGLLRKGYDAAVTSKERLADAKLEGLDEEISSLDAEIQSLETLQDKLEDAKGNKAELAQIQNELNDAIGDTPGLLNGEGKAYDIANAKLKAYIESKKQERDASKQDKIDTSKEKFDNNAYEVDGWFGFDASADTMRKYAKMYQSYVDNFNNLPDDDKIRDKFKDADEYAQSVFAGTTGEIDMQGWTSYWDEQVQVAYDAFDAVIEDYEGYGGQDFLKNMISNMVRGGADFTEISNAVQAVMDNEQMQEAINTYWESLINPDIDSEKALENVKKALDEIVKLYPGLESFFDGVYERIISGGNKVADTTKENANEMTVSLAELEKVSDNIKPLGTAFKELSDDGYITIKTLKEMKDAADLSSDEWADYEAKLLKAKVGSSEFNEVMSELTYKILDNTFAGKDLNNLTEQQIATTLRENGVVNASAVAHDWLAKAKAKEKIASMELVKGSNLDIAALTSEASACGVTKNAYLELVAKEIIFNRNDLDVEDKVKKLNQIAVAAGVAGINMDNLNSKFKTQSAKNQYVEESGGKVVTTTQTLPFPDVSINPAQTPYTPGKYLTIPSALSDSGRPETITLEEPKFLPIGFLPNINSQEIVEYELPDGTKTKDFNEYYASVEMGKFADRIANAANNITIPNYSGAIKDGDKKNEALDNYLKDAENRYKIHQDEVKYIQELEYAYNNLTKDEKERLDIVGKVNEAYRDLADNRIKDIEHQIDLAKELNEYADVTDYYKQIQKIAHEEANRLRAMGYDDNSNEIQKLQKEWWDAQNSIVDWRWDNSNNWIDERNTYNDWSLFDDSEVAAWERVIKWLNEEYPNDIEKIKKAEQNLFEARKKEFDKGTGYGNTYLDSRKTLLQSYYDVTNSIAEAQHEINKELETSKTMYEYLDKETQQLLFNQEDYNELSDELYDIQYRADKLKRQYERDLSNSTLETIESITSNYQMQYETLMKSYEIAKADLEIAKKKQKLNNVLNERNVRMFINGSWQWVANTEDVANAKSELADAEYAKRVEEAGLTQQQSINNLTKQQDELGVVIKSFENGVIDLEEAIRQAEEAIGSMPNALASIFNNAKVRTPSSYSSGGSGGGSGGGFSGGNSGGGQNTSYINWAKSQMAENSKNWHTADANGKKALEAANQALGKAIDSTYDPTTGKWKHKYATGSKYTKDGLSLLGEEGFEAYISSNGRLIPINQPMIGDIPSGGVVFNTEQMKNLRTMWDMSNLKFNGGTFVGGAQPQQIDQSQDNRIIINGMTVDSGSADGQALISALRRYVGNH